MKYMPKPNWANWPTWSTYGTVLVGGFIAGGLSATYPPAFVPMPQKPVVVREVKTASIDPYSKRTQELCATAADSVARMREEWREMKAKMAPSKVAPGK